MSYLEDDLKMALQRTEPSEDFVNRVLARVNQPTPEPGWWERLTVLLRPPRLQWVVACVILSIMIPVASVQYRKQQRMRAEGEEAKEQLMFAVRVAGSRLHRVQQKVLEMGRMETRL
jgi:hypothetical protein